MDKTIFKKSGFTLTLEKQICEKTGCTGYKLIILEAPQEKKDEDLIGKLWSNVTIDVEGLEPDEFALDNFFCSFSPFEFVCEVLGEIAETLSPHRYIKKGFLEFPVFKKK